MQPNLKIQEHFVSGQASTGSGGGNRADEVITQDRNGISDRNKTHNNGMKVTVGSSKEIDSTRNYAYEVNEAVPRPKISRKRWSYMQTGSILGGVGALAYGDTEIVDVECASVQTARLAHFSAQNLSKIDELSLT